MKESLREHYHLGRTLQERLADAIAAEQYELAAQLRDEISQKRNGGRN
jgi:protein-arginine kinase activator protein McsA